MPTNAAFRRKSASTRATSVPLLGTSLAAETSFQQFFWNQRFKPGFLESVEAADTSVCATRFDQLACSIIPRVDLPDNLQCHLNDSTGLRAKDAAEASGRNLRIGSAEIYLVKGI